MTDRKQLEAIAKAMKIEVTLEHGWTQQITRFRGLPNYEYWDPYNSNENCAAMCAQLGIDTVWRSGACEACAWNGAHNTREFYVDYDNDRLAAWRAAACNVAAELGEENDH